MPVSGQAGQVGLLETVALLGGELKGSAPGWMRVCRKSRPHGLQGGRISRRAEHKARVGPDEELLVALVCIFLGAREQTPEPRNPVIVALISQGVQVCLRSFFIW